MIPWYYRFRLTNWLMAQPWRWRMRTIYRVYRNGASNPFTGRVYHPGYGPLKSAWMAIKEPHVHHESEE